VPSLVKEVNWSWQEGHHINKLVDCPQSLRATNAASISTSTSRSNHLHDPLSFKLETFADHPGQPQVPYSFINLLLLTPSA